MKVQKPLKAVSSESDDPINDTPTSSPSPQVKMAKSWVGHFSVETSSKTIHTGNVPRNGYIMLHHLAGCLLLLPMWESVIVLCFGVRYSLFWFCSRLDGEERPGCFAWFVFLVSRGGCVALPRGAMGLSAVCECGITWSYSLFLLVNYNYHPSRGWQWMAREATIMVEDNDVLICFRTLLNHHSSYTRPKKKRRKFILKILRIKWELQNFICYLCFATIPATHYSHCFIELSQPKLVYWLSFYFQVFHVHIHFI